MNLSGITEKQRTRPDGTVYNRFLVRWYDENHRQKLKTFDSLAQAKKFKHLVEGNKVQGLPSLPKTAPLVPYSRVAAEWLATNPANKESVRHGYEGIVRKHLLPYFDDLPVSEIRKQTVRELIAHMADEGSGAGTVRNAVRNVLKPSLDLAVENGYIVANPAMGLKLPATAHTEMLFLDPAEVDQLAEEITQPFALLIAVDAYTGLRAGELAALRVKHLKLMDRSPHIRVAESASVVRGKGTVYGTTKTDRVRYVPIPSFLLDSLTAYIAPRAKDPEAFVFLSPEGKPLNYKNFYGRHFRPAVQRLVERGDWPERLAGLRFHDLRHTCATLMINVSGANPLQVSRRLGHSSISVTYDRYGHLFPQSDELISTGLEKAYWSAKQEAEVRSISAAGDRESSATGPIVKLG